MDWLRKVIIAIIAFLMALFNDLFGQEIVNNQPAWTLQKCIEYAFENNIQIKQQTLNEELYRLDLIKNKYNFLPSLNANATHGYTWGRSVDRYTNQFSESEIRSNNFSLSSQLVIFNGFQLYNNLRQSELYLTSIKYDSEKLKNDIALGIATAYLNILFSQSLFENSKLQLEATKVQLERTKKLVSSGTLSELNLFNIEAQYASEELQMVNYENQLNIANLTLIQMLDLKETNNFKISEPVITISIKNELSLTPEQIYYNSLENMPEIKAAEYKIKAAEKTIKISKGNLYPTLTLNGSIGTGYSSGSQEITNTNMLGFDTLGYVYLTNQPVISSIPRFEYNYATKSFNNQIDDNLSKSLSFNLSIPIFNNYQVRSVINKAKINLKISELNYELQKNQLYKSIQQAHADAIAALKKYYSAEKAVKAYKLAYEQIEQKYTIGSISYFEFSDAKAKYTKAQNDLTQAKYDYIFKTKIIDFYLGKSITLD